MTNQLRIDDVEPEPLTTEQLKSIVGKCHNCKSALIHEIIRKKYVNIKSPTEGRERFSVVHCNWGNGFKPPSPTLGCNRYEKEETK